MSFTHRSLDIPTYRKVKEKVKKNPGIINKEYLFFYKHIISFIFYNPFTSYKSRIALGFRQRCRVRLRGWRRVQRAARRGHRDEPPSARALAKQFVHRGHQVKITLISKSHLDTNIHV